MRARALVLACAAALVPNAALAQPAPPNDGPTGYVGKGDLVVQTAIAGVAVTIGGHIALEERGSRLRIDVLSLAIPGADPTISALAGSQLFPPGGFTIVYDRRVATYTVWSAGKRAFYTGGGHANGPSANVPSYASPAASAIANGGGLFDAFGALRGLKSDKTFEASVTMTGHASLYGHPVTMLSYRLTQVPLSGAAFDAHGELSLADDLDAVPVRVTASVASGNIPKSSLRLDLTSLAKRLPDDADFVPPPDYARTNDLGDVLGRSLPI